ncbi:MAG: S46 family peptidase [Acidobacteriota bacterium]
MTPRRLFAFVLGLLLVATAYGASIGADEGFWPYNSIPRAAIRSKYRFTVTDQWLNHLQLATIRFGGATGSIVSPNGLVLTNHHVGLRTLQNLSTPGKDYVKSGFYAPTTAEELKVPGMTLSVLQSIEDVTEKVNAPVKPGMTAAQVNEARQSAIRAVQGQAAPGVSRQVVSLYAGALYHLYTYKVYSDVRLVFGVEYQTGFYGGDPDNFTYPRYNLDVCVFRLYESDKPAETPVYLKWSPNGSRENELVFTTGHPGSTQRLNTVAHLRYLRDTALPFSVANLEMREAAIKQWASLSAENARQTLSELFGVQNSLKSQRGRLGGLRDPALMGKKEAAEARLRAELAKNPAQQQELGSAWDVIEETLAVAKQLDAERNFVANAAGLNSTLFAMARNLVRAADNPPAPEGGRGGAPGGAPGGGGRGGAPAAPNLAREKVNLTASLAFMQEFLGAEHAIAKRILAGKTPAARASELVDQTRLLDSEIQTLLRAGGKAAIDASTDPMIVLARSLEADAQAVAKRYQDEVTAIQQAEYPKIGQAVFVVDGPKAYPDATGTLRLSYGTVKSYVEDGRRIPAFTDFAGLYARSAQHSNEPPWDLAPRWVENRAAINLRTPFNFVSTNDIVGGNSGSAVVNRKGEVVGLVFDGNIQMLPGYYIYEDSVNRTVSVDSRAIIEALRGIYKADALADEMTGRGRR